MATFNLRRFSEPEALKQIEERHIRRFLLQYDDYLGKRGMNLDHRRKLDYDRLVTVLIDPDDDMPVALVDALYMIHEMATEEAMEDLLDVLPDLPDEQRTAIETTPDLTAADLAVQVWLVAPHLLESKYELQFMENRRSFDYYLANEPPRESYVHPSGPTIHALEEDLGAWFASRKKGDVVRVFVFPKEDEVWFLVRHGETFRREAKIGGTVFYRPEAHDVLIYNPISGELKINASSPKEKQAYRRAFGTHFFSGENHFRSSSSKYTLERLRTDGPDSLFCGDVVGLDWIRLKEIIYYWGGPAGEIEIRRAGDVFAALEARGGKIQKTRIGAARFEVKFSDSKTTRSVTIRPPQVAKFTRDSDGKLIERWLENRGFSLTGTGKTDEEAVSSVAST
jgi:hypothetical protein